MKRVYRSESAAMAWHIRNVLQQHQVDAVVKNDRLYSVAGEVPFIECLAEVWVKQSLDAQRATRIIQELESGIGDSDAADWHCGHCGEDNLGTYAVCWNCEQSHDQE